MRTRSATLVSAIVLAAVPSALAVIGTPAPRTQASMEKLPFTMNPSDQLVNIAGDTAVIHGVNTLIQNGKVLARERFTDLFGLREGVWKALSAQETKL